MPCITMLHESHCFIMLNINLHAYPRFNVFSHRYPSSLDAASHSCKALLYAMSGVSSTSTFISRLLIQFCQIFEFNLNICFRFPILTAIPALHNNSRTQEVIYCALCTYIISELFSSYAARSQLMFRINCLDTKIDGALLPQFSSHF